MGHPSMNILILEFVRGFQPEEGFEAASEGFPSMFWPRIQSSPFTQDQVQLNVLR